MKKLSLTLTVAAGAVALGLTAAAACPAHTSAKKMTPVKTAQAPSTTVTTDAKTKSVKQ